MSMNISEEQRREALLNRMREDRNKFLSESDWTQLPDNGLTTEKRAEWATYRQELRDIIATLDPDTHRSYVTLWNSTTWPTKPS
jgi:hypothetical protein